jgi:hypothetical protein
LPKLRVLLARFKLCCVVTLNYSCYIAAGAMPALAAVCSRVTQAVQALQQLQLQEYLHTDSQQAKDQQQRRQRQVQPQQHQQGQSEQEQQQLPQHNQLYVDIMLLATSLLNVTQSLFILWPSPRLTSKVVAAAFPAVGALAATVLRHAQALGAARSLPSGLEAVRTTAFTAASSFAGIMACSCAQLGSAP